MDKKVNLLLIDLLELAGRVREVAPKLVTELDGLDDVADAKAKTHIASSVRVVCIRCLCRVRGGGWFWFSPVRGEDSAA